MTFNEYVKIKEAEYPVAQGVVPPPAQKAGKILDIYKPTVKTASELPQDQQWRILNAATNNGKGFTPEEYKIWKQQQKELQRYGVVLTPFRAYGGGATINPQRANVFNFGT